MIGKQCVAVAALAVVCCGLVHGALGEQVEVVVDTADLRLGKEVVGAVKRGDRLEVVQRQYPWICVRSGSADSATKGWLLSTEVQTFVAPGIDENATAPPGFGGVRAVVNGTHYVVTRPNALYIELTLFNDGWEAVPFDAAKIELETAGRAWTALPPNVVPQVMGYRSIPLIDNGVVRNQSVKEMARLGAGSLAPGGKTTGWVGFSIAIPPRHVGLQGRPVLAWTLYIPLGDDELQVDLLEKEVEAVGARIRPAAADAAVSVLEIGPRVNAVNFPRVEECLDKLVAEGSGFLIRFTTPICSVDDHARVAFRPVAARLAAANARWVYVITPEHGRNDLLSILGGRGAEMAISEEAGAAKVRSWRTDGPQVLVERLSDPTEEVRVGAASAIKIHLDHPEASQALAGAVRDQSVRVRLAALQSLAAGLGGLPRGWPGPLGPGATRVPLLTPPTLEGGLLEAVLQATGDANADVRAAAIGLLYYCTDARGTEAIVAALQDSDPLVQANAARSAARHPTDATRAALATKIDELELYPRDTVLARALFQAAGQIKATAAEASLVQHADRGDRYVQAAAIDALRDMGVLSPSAAALAKLRKGQYGSSDWRALVETQDAETIKQLHELAVDGSAGESAVLAACLLAERKDPVARKALFDMLAKPAECRTLPLAVGRLGDPDGIEPLEQALQQSVPPFDRIQVMVGLLMLNAPGAVERIQEAFAKPMGSIEARRTISLLGEWAGEAAVPILAPLLDDNAFTREAASTLWRIGTANAQAALKQRLSDIGYRNSEAIVSAIAGHLSKPVTPDEVSQREEDIQAVLSFIAELGESASPTARTSIGAELRAIEQTIGAERFAELDDKAP